MKTFIDYWGLTTHDHPQAYRDIVQAAFPTAAPVPDRLVLLSQLREGAGVRIVTGPSEAPFWSLAGREVSVWVWPDEYEWEERTDDERTWAYLAVGLEPTEAKRLLARKTAIPDGHRYYGDWARAQRLLEALARDAQPLVEEEVGFDVISIEEMEGLLRAARDSNEFLALDGEWEPESGRIIGLAASNAEYNSYVCLWGADVEYDGVSEQRLREAFTRYVTCGGKGLLHNGRADLQALILDDIGVEWWAEFALHDTIVLAYLLGEDKLGLKELTRKYLGREPQEYPGKLQELSARAQARYAAAGDTRNTYDLFTTLMPKVYEAGQMRTYLEFERPLVPIVADMERQGSPVDMAAVKKLYREHVAIEEGLRRAIRANYGRDVKTDEEALGFLHDHEIQTFTLDQRVISQSQHWAVDLLMTYRQTRTRRRNFLGKTLKKWVAQGKPDDFRLYPRFNQAGTVAQDAVRAPRSGRFSSSNPNLQNQPRKIREVFTAPSGHLFWSFDWSGLELHIAAALSKDPVMLETLRSGGDLHGLFQERIRQMTGVTVERVIAKSGNFEQLYGGKAAKLVQILAKDRAFIDLATAQAVVDAHESTFTVYHKWAADRIREGHRTGYAETAYGRRRFLTEFTSGDAEVISHGERACVNHAIQGTAADICKRAMLAIVPVLSKYGAHLALQVHDELAGWIPATADVDGFVKEVKEVMAVEIEGLRLKVEGGVGASWAEVH